MAQATRAWGRLIAVQISARGDYAVRASYGHIRDLPKSKLGVDPENDFLPDYIVPEDRPQFGPYVADITLRRAARFEVRAMRPDGDVRELEVSIP